MFLSGQTWRLQKFQISQLLLNPLQIKIRLLLKGFFVINKKKQVKNFVATALKYIPRLRNILYSSPRSAVLHSIFVRFVTK